MPPSAAQAYQDLTSFQQPDSATVLGQAQDKYGVKGLQDRVNTYKTLTQNLTGAIAAVDPSVTGRTSGSLVTEGQRSALVNRERAPIIGNLGTANQGLESATGDFNTADKNARDTAQMTIADNQTKYNKLKDTYDVANSREQAAQQLARQQAQDAEATRQFNVSQANSRANSSASSAATKQATLTEASNTINSALKAKLGKDGYASPYDYNAAKSAWAQDGLDAKQFDAIFGKYKNPKQPKNQYK